MDFILGIFIGAFAMIALGAWLNERTKQQRAKADRIAVHYLFKHLDAALASQGFRHGGQSTLKEQLQAAIDRDDFEEAAKIRDLMNKG